VFATGDSGTRFAENEIVRNPWIWGALVLCIGLLLAASLLPWFGGQMFRSWSSGESV
jgi:hypothetical protein